MEFAGRLRWRMIPTRCRDLAGLVTATGFGPRQSSDRTFHHTDVDMLVFFWLLLWISSIFCCLSIL